MKKTSWCLDHIHQVASLRGIEILLAPVLFVNEQSSILPGYIPFYPTVGLNGILSRGKRDVNFAILRRTQQ